MKAIHSFEASGNTNLMTKLYILEGLNLQLYRCGNLKIALNDTSCPILRPKSRVHNFRNREAYSIPVLWFDKCLDSITATINNVILRSALMLIFSESGETTVSSSYPQSVHPIHSQVILCTQGIKVVKVKIQIQLYLRAARQSTKGGMKFSSIHS
jgi:hypothetical protein